MNKRKTYKPITEIVTVPTFPIFDKSTAKITMKSIPDKLLATKKFSSDLTSIEQARKNSSSLSNMYKERYLKGDTGAIYELIRINKLFFKADWVQEEICKSIYLGKDISKKNRGHQRGDSKINGTLLVNLVDALESQDTPKDEIFNELKDVIFLSYERIKEIYYDSKGKRDLNEIPLSFQNSNIQEPASISKKELAIRKHNALTLKKDGTVQYRGKTYKKAITRLNKDGCIEIVKLIK